MSRVDEWISVTEEDVDPGYRSVRMTLRISVEALIDKKVLADDPGLLDLRKRALRDTIESHVISLGEGGFD